MTESIKNMEIRQRYEMSSYYKLARSTNMKKVYICIDKKYHEYILKNYYNSMLLEMSIMLMERIQNDMDNNSEYNPKEIDDNDSNKEFEFDKGLESKDFELSDNHLDKENEMEEE